MGTTLKSVCSDMDCPQKMDQERRVGPAGKWVQSPSGQAVLGSCVLGLCFRRWHLCSRLSCSQGRDAVRIRPEWNALRCRTQDRDLSLLRSILSESNISIGHNFDQITLGPCVISLP